MLLPDDPLLNPPPLLSEERPEDPRSKPPLGRDEELGRLGAGLTVPWLRLLGCLLILPCGLDAGFLETPPLRLLGVLLMVSPERDDGFLLIVPCEREEGFLDDVFLSIVVPLSVRLLGVRLTPFRLDTAFLVLAERPVKILPLASRETYARPELLRWRAATSFLLDATRRLLL